MMTPRGPRERVARAGFRKRKDRADVPGVTAPADAERSPVAAASEDLLAGQPP